MKTTYTKNDIVRLMTKDPCVHVNVMFSGEDVNPDNIRKEEYIGRIKAVIAGGKSYLISTISPMKGFICIADVQDIICRMDVSELDDDQKRKYHSRHDGYEVPNCYENDPESEELRDLDIEQKCRVVARKAIDSLFPGKNIVEMNRTFGDFLLERYLKGLDESLLLLPEEKHSNRNKEKLLEVRDHLAKLFKTLRFKEFYMVNVGFREKQSAEDMEFIKCKRKKRHFGNDFSIDDFEDNMITKFWTVAVSTDFDEAYVLRSIKERTDFCTWLGPEHHNMEELSQKFFRLCLQFSEK